MWYISIVFSDWVTIEYTPRIYIYIYIYIYISLFLTDPIPTTALTRPAVKLDYTSLESMFLVCDVENDVSFGIQYKVTWYEDDTKIAEQLLDNGVVQHKLLVAASNFTQKQTVRNSLQLPLAFTLKDMLSNVLPLNNWLTNEFLYTRNNYILKYILFRTPMSVFLVVPTLVVTPFHLLLIVYLFYT